MKKVCFATPGAVAMLQQGDGAVYGGSELRALRFAKGLAARGIAVSMIAPSAVPVGALREAGIALVHGGTSRAAALLRRFLPGQGAPANVWEMADADLYISFGAGEYNADLADWCRSTGRAMLLGSGSDADFDGESRPGNTARNRWGSRFDRCYDSMTQATVVTVQTDTQRQLLRERYHRDGQVIRNPAPLTPRSQPVQGGRYLLWVGKAVANKKPDLALDLARLCPDIQFRMIANKVGEADFQRLIADKPANVEIVESVSRADMEREYENAFGFVSTSIIEGFPNTFIEAGAFGLPIFSLHIDPDGMVEREVGGVVAHGDMGELAAGVGRFHRDRALAEAAGGRMLDYVKREHDSEGRVAEFARLAADILEGRIAPDYASAIATARMN
jgi:glycosyltransferase involved in cell wall biosynthesis